jgi:hypothetical protein
MTVIKHSPFADSCKNKGVLIFIALTLHFIISLTIYKCTKIGPTTTIEYGNTKKIQSTMAQWPW